MYIELPLKIVQTEDDMDKSPLPRLIQPFTLLVIASFILSCQVTHQPQPVSQASVLTLKGVLMWKGDSSESGLYASETTLTPANVNVNQFGRVGSFQADGIVIAQPLFVSGLDMGSGATHDVVVVATEHDSVYAVDAANGKQRWKHETGDKILGAPNWVKSPQGSANWVLVGSYDFKLHCVDAATGRSNWVYETGNYINGSPAVYQGQTVFGGCDAILHVISLTKGEKVKEIEAGAYIAGSVALADKRAYFGHYENEFLCIDLDKGERAWTFKDRDFPYFSSPAVTQDRVVFGGRDRRLHCVKRDTGENVWAFSAQGKVDSSPVVVGDKVAVGSDDGRVYVVSLKDGQKLWSYEIGQPLGSSPAVLDGKILIGSDDGSVYCFGAKK